MEHWTQILVISENIIHTVFAYTELVVGIVIVITLHNNIIPCDKTFEGKTFAIFADFSKS